MSLATARAASVEGGFNCYPIQPVKHAVPTAIWGSDRLTRSYSDDLLWAISKNRMDAAGHFILAEVGCGTGCIRLASVNVLTGGVRWMPKTISSWPIKMLQPVLYRDNSRLIVIFGRLDEHGSAGPFRYLLATDGFQSISNDICGMK
jgi:hypothetical protein